MTKKSKTSAEWHAEINARCWKDPAFKKKFLANPRKAVEELGLQLPDKVKVKVVEAAPGEWVIPLIPAPDNTRELSEEQLRRMSAAGDTWWVFACSGECGGSNVALGCPP